MVLDQDLYERLKPSDKEEIKKILAKGKKRPRKKAYTKKWLYNYLDESFKDYTVNNFHETIDYLELMYKVGNWAGVSPTRQKGDLLYIYENFLITEMEDITSSEKARFLKLLNKYNITKKDIKKINEEYD